MIITRHKSKKETIYYHGLYSPIPIGNKFSHNKFTFQKGSFLIQEKVLDIKETFFFDEHGIVFNYKPFVLYDVLKSN